MTSISWEDYLTEAIKVFRQGLETLISATGQELLRERALDRLPIEPCQIEVLEFSAQDSAVLILAHDENLPDMFFSIRKNVKGISESEFVKKYHYGGPHFVEGSILSAKATGNLAILAEKFATVSDRPESPRQLAERFLEIAHEELRDIQVDAIEQNTDGLKKTIAKIPEKYREELADHTKKIDRSLQEIKRLDDDIGKVRQLVGVTKEIQDWKLLVSDVGKLKEEHVSKEVFDTHIKRVDEKIDKGLETLNARIEDLKAIKFWSKRTIVDIVLAIIATASTIIAALLATGLLKL